MSVKNRTNQSLIDKKIERLIAGEKWNPARKLIIKKLKKYPKDHWLWDRLSVTHFEQFDYEKALPIIKRALKIAKKCPLVLWDYAGCLYMLEKERAALKIYKQIVKRGIASLAYDECGEGIAWAKSFYNDCFYRIALCYRDLGYKKQCDKFLKQHIKNRRSLAYKSIYPLKEVQKIA